jgi:hypothetical protein
MKNTVPGGRSDAWKGHPSGDPPGRDKDWLKAVPVIANVNRPLNTPTANHIHRARFGTIKPKEPDNAA